MRRRTLHVGAVVVVLAAVSLSADVAPFPSWRAQANDSIAAIVQSGTAVYVSGRFTKIGRAIPGFTGILDPVTLGLTPAANCARSRGYTVYWPFSIPTGALDDGAGPFPVPDDTALVKLGPDCRFDRRFRLRLPVGASLDLFGQEPVVTGGAVYAHGTYHFGSGGVARFVVEADATTGVLGRWWLDQTFYGIRLVGATSAGRLVAMTYGAAADPELGWFDTAAGAFVPVRGFTSSPSVLHVGDVVVVAEYAGAGTRRDVVALDPATLAPLPQWPAVSLAPVGAAAATGFAGRLFLAGPGLTVDGVVAPNLVGFDLPTGARDAGWVAPAWMSDPETSVTALAPGASHLIVIGNFAPGAPRDTAAAFDAVTGVLDPWTMPYVAAAVTTVAGRLLFNDITAENRVPRRALAAIDAKTGDILPWTPSGTTGAETALAIDPAGGHLYAARPGAVRRWHLATGAMDATWALDVINELDEPGLVTALALEAGRLYAVGRFVSVRTDAAGAWQPREGAAAVTTAGTLASWRPRLTATCYVYFKQLVPVPCITHMVAAGGRIVLRGTLTSLDGLWPGALSAVALTPDTAAVDPWLPPVPDRVMYGMAGDPAGLTAAVVLDQVWLARVDVLGGPRLIGPLPFAPWTIAVRDGRVYADVERDAATALPTGNPFTWSTPVAATDGMVDFSGIVVQLHPAAASVAPRAPQFLAADLNGPRVTFTWRPGAGDLGAFVAPPPPGGTAATAHTILASLTPGGPPLAQIDTGSADTTFSITAPAGVFYVRVQARNAFGASPPSAEVTVHVQPATPEPPVATLGRVVGRTVYVEWQAPPHGWPPSGYLLEAGTSPGAADLGTLPLTGLELTASVPPGRYYVRVRAVNAQGASAPGAEVVLDVP